MHQNNEKAVLKDVLKIGGAYAAFCIGSGFATGQEIMQFFTAFGWAGIGSAIITMILYVWMGVTLMRDGRKYSFTSDAAVWKHYCGKGLGVAMNCFGTFVIFGIYGTVSGYSQPGWPSYHVRHLSGGRPDGSEPLGRCHRLHRPCYHRLCAGYRCGHDCS